MEQVTSISLNLAQHNSRNLIGSNKWLVDYNISLKIFLKIICNISSQQCIFYLGRLLASALWEMARITGKGPSSSFYDFYSQVRHRTFKLL